MGFETVRQAMADALTFVLPVECAGCGCLDIALCERCRAALAPRLIAQRLDDGTPVWSALPFEGVTAAVVRALKEQGRTSLAGALAPALAAAAGPLRSELDHERYQAVPVPTSRAAFRRRGYRVTELLARRAGLHPVRALRLRRRVGDQRTLGREERRDNVARSMVAHGVTGCRVLVVDDVITTGATLEEAVRALRAGGARVVGAVTVAATARRSAMRETVQENP